MSNVILKNNCLNRVIKVKLFLLSFINLTQLKIINLHIFVIIIILSFFTFKSILYIYIILITIKKNFLNIHIFTFIVINIIFPIWNLFTVDILYIFELITFNKTIYGFFIQMVYQNVLNV